MQHSILLIDDDESLSRAIELSLKSQDYEVHTAADGSSGLRIAYEKHPELVILDVMMPHMDGWEVCQRLKEMTTIPVLILTARVSEADAVRSFACGADDYLRKPFSLSELHARVQSLLRRSTQMPTRRTSVLKIGDVELDTATHSASLQGKPLHLTPSEFRLLSYFMQNPGRLLTYRELLVHGWGNQYADEHQYLRLYVRYLRAKLCDNPNHPTYIFNVRGEGYRFCEP